MQPIKKAGYFKYMGVFFQASRHQMAHIKNATTETQRNMVATEDF